MKCVDYIWPFEVLEAAKFPADVVVLSLNSMRWELGTERHSTRIRVMPGLGLQITIQELNG